jgi:hypothetical protein
MRCGKQKIKTGINKLIIIKTEIMGNRKEQIENLKNEIAQKEQTLNELITTEDQEQQEHPDQDVVNEFVDNLNI